MVLGETHPAVRRHEGEKYRTELAQLVTKLDLKQHVKFYDQYLDLEHIIQFLQATDVYLSTSINPNQAVSGTLSYALGTGRAVISTAFAQAREIITPKNGRLIPIKDSQALSGVILELLADPDRLLEMHQNAFKSTRPMLWSHVAEEYSDILTRLVLPPINLKYLKKMTDEVGLFQFAKLDEPHIKFGYTLDDNARALLVCSQLVEQKYPSKDVAKLVSKYLKFIEICQQENGSFVNYVEHESKMATKQNTIEDLSDAHARAALALSEVMQNTAFKKSIRDAAQHIFICALPHLNLNPHLRSKAMMIKAACLAHKVLPTYQKQLLNIVEENCANLVSAFKKNDQQNWHWFEDQLGYNNALLSESLMIGGTFLKNKEYVEVGVTSL